MFKKLFSSLIFAALALLSVVPAEAALVWQDRTVQTTSTTGTSDFVLSGTPTGYQAWSGVGNTNTAYYVATDGTNWEIGLGTYSTTGPTLARTTVLSSSTGSKISFGAGVKNVSLAVPSSWLATVITGGANLASNNIVIGNGALGVQTAAGLKTDGTGQLQLGVAGTSVGSVQFNNATSGTVTLQPATGALGTSVLSLPPSTDTIAALAASQTLTNKTLNCANNTCTIRAASDVTGTLPIANGGTNLTTYTTGDIVYATASNVLGKLSASSTAGQVLTSNGTGVAPTYQTVSGGGWTQVCSLTTTSGATQTCPTISTSSGYHQWICELFNVKPSGTDKLQLELSSTGGAAYGAATAAQTGSATTTQTLSGAFTIDAVENTATTLKAMNSNLATASTQNGGSGVPILTNTAAAANDIRFSWVSGATFSAGTITCYGVK